MSPPPPAAPLLSPGLSRSSPSSPSSISRAVSSVPSRLRTPVCAAVLLAALTTGCTDTSDGSAPGRTPASATASRGPVGSAPAPRPEPPSVPPTATASAPSPAPGRAGVLVVVTVTGGIAGVNDRLTVREDGTYTTASPPGPDRSGRMTPAGLRALRRALDKAGFPRLPATATGPPVADGFHYRITHGGHTVVTDDVSQPPALRDVFTALPSR
ncbi:hypothetical protein ACFYT4_29770 [Streptomyces sp. NPDC004609]|uniref:hypothetical protein n=1 Tax=Streptomyces sp. NPDC004609 TaxID=3364704 RepID=UPI0036894BE4